MCTCNRREAKIYRKKKSVKCLLLQFGEFCDTRQETNWDLRGEHFEHSGFLFLLKMSPQNTQALYQEGCPRCSVLTVLPFGPQLFYLSFESFTISGSTKGSSCSKTKLKSPWSDILWVLQYGKRTLSTDESGCMSVFNVIAMMMSSRHV